MFADHEFINRSIVLNFNYYYFSGYTRVSNYKFIRFCVYNLHIYTVLHILQYDNQGSGVKMLESQPSISLFQDVQH